MQPGWEPVTSERTYAFVPPGEECPSVSFKNRQLCVDECDGEGTYCSFDFLYECGNFDDDECLELRQNDFCYFMEISETYDECVGGSSITSWDVTEGFCNDESQVAFCDEFTYTEEIYVQDCGETECSEDEYCYENDVYNSGECVVRGCEIDTGLCYQEFTSDTTLVEDCGTDGTSDEFCDGENIVYTDSDKYCVEDNGDAFCESSSETIVVEECGPDTCTEFTEMNPFVKEYVHDENSCIKDEYAYCAYDPGNIYDYCLDEDILEQSYCLDSDYAYEEFNCNDLDGCFEFTYKTCESCVDPLDARCNGEMCTKIGEEYRDYGCGEGACQFVTLEMIDVDYDKIDDRCDDCIDVDRDGACDDVDNCIGFSNPTQVDTDKDGLGNACDNDRDGDGYIADVDCDDWNADVNPGADEVKNNNRDDDCNPDTPDKGLYTPKQALYVDVDYDETLIEEGKDFTIVVKTQNNHRDSLDDIKVMVSIPGMQIKQARLVRQLSSGNFVTRIFELDMPENFESDHEWLRVSVSNDEYKRIIYREVKLS